MSHRNTRPRYAENQLLTLRVTPEEKVRLREKAAVIGVSLSEYARAKISGVGRLSRARTSGPDPSPKN